MSDQPIIVETCEKPPNSCVIWLHGLGADGHDFEAIVDQFTFPENINIRFIFPHAPMQAVTINQGFVMRSWYDITSRDICSEQDEKGIKESQQFVEQLVQQQVNEGIAPERIILAGFSQGGVIVLQVALRSQHKLGGVMALSTYLALEETLGSDKTAQNQNIPLFLAHGSADPVIEIKWAYQTHSQLIREKFKVEWFEYSGMAHSVSAQEIADINRWLTQTLS